MECVRTVPSSFMFSVHTRKIGILLVSPREFVENPSQKAHFATIATPDYPT